MSHLRTITIDDDDDTVDHPSDEFQIVFFLLFFSVENQIYETNLALNRPQNREIRNGPNRWYVDRSSQYGEPRLASHCEYIIFTEWSTKWMAILHC